MNGAGLSHGIIGSTTVIAAVYMMERGYKWWQIALIVIIAILFVPYYKKDSDGERVR